MLSAFFFIIAATLKGLGMVSSVIGSVLSMLPVIWVFVMDFRTLKEHGADSQIIKTFGVCVSIFGILSIVVNQFLFNRVNTQGGLVGLWVLWNIVGEGGLAYFRMAVRRVDLTKSDATAVPLLQILLSILTICGKKVPLLCLTDYNYIFMINVLSLLIEYFGRVTCVARDRFYDRRIYGVAEADLDKWKDPLHRQVYIHNELISELLEVLFPIPITIMLYFLQFSPTGEKVLLMPLLTNCLLGILQEFVADCTSIMYGSNYQNKFYRTAASTLFTGRNYQLLCVLAPMGAYGMLNLFFFTYLRIAKTHDGDFVSTF